jgi:hypothetical protein
MTEDQVRGTGRSEAALWTFVLSIPPGIGVTGFVSVALQHGAITLAAVAGGLLTTLAVAGLVFLMVRGGPEGHVPDGEHPI